jgi:hypothetical protein
MKAEPGPGQQPDCGHRSTGRQDRGLDDLHPGGALHAADEHVEDHEDADDGDDDILAG